MKGLLLKDYYMMLKYCKAFFLCAAVFIAVSVLNDDNAFFIFYPCLIAGMLPATLLSYDERSKWNQYCGTLPYSKAQIVSGKYLIGAITGGSVFVLVGIAQAARVLLRGGDLRADYLELMMVLFVMICLVPSVILPFMFRFGVEKGRIAYYVVVGAFCAGSVLLSNNIPWKGNTFGRYGGVMPVLCIAAAAAFILSWRLSVRLYEKRELY